MGNYNKAVLRRLLKNADFVIETTLLGAGVAMFYFSLFLVVFVSPMEIGNRVMMIGAIWEAVAFFLLTGKRRVATLVVTELASFLFCTFIATPVVILAAGIVRIPDFYRKAFAFFASMQKTRSYHYH